MSVDSKPKVYWSKTWELPWGAVLTVEEQRALREYHRQLSHIMSYELETAMEEAWPESMKGRMKP